MRQQRAQSLVNVILALAAVIGLTSAVQSDELAVVAGGNSSELANGEGGALGGLADEHPTATTGPGGSQAGDGTSPGVTQQGGSGTGQTAGPTGSCPTRVDESRPAVKVAYLVIDFTGVGALTGNSGGNEQDEANRADREWRALFDDVNKTGGICGRKVEARGFRSSVGEMNDPSHRIERCVEVTEDFKASYVIDTWVMLTPDSQQCFAQHRVPLVTLASTLSERLLGELRPYVATTFPTLDRQYAALVPKLREVGYLDGARIGVLFDDDWPYWEEPYRRILEPALAAAGATPVTSARARWDDQAAQANAVVKFNNAGVTHVLHLAAGFHFLGFSNAAEAQGFRPRYAFTDYENVAGVAAVFGNPSQMANAVAVSACNDQVCITEGADRASGDRRSPYDRSKVSPGLRRCLDELSRVRGVDYYRPDAAGSSDSTWQICDHFFLWRDAMRAAGREPAPAQFGDALRRLGTGYVSAQAFATNFGDGRQAGATHFAAGIYNSACQCWPRATPWSAPGNG